MIAMDPLIKLRHVIFKIIKIKDIQVEQMNFNNLRHITFICGIF